MDFQLMGSKGFLGSTKIHPEQGLPGKVYFDHHLMLPALGLMKIRPTGFIQHQFHGFNGCFMARVDHNSVIPWPGKMNPPLTIGVRPPRSAFKMSPVLPGEPGGIFVRSS